MNIWHDRINQCEALQQRKHPEWNTALDLYNCAWFEKNFGGFNQDRVDVHFANWYINNVIYMTYSRDPYIFTKPNAEMLLPFSETMEKAINVLWRRLEMKAQLKRCILSASLMPPGWIKVGYTAKIGQDVAKIDENRAKGVIATMKELLQMGGEEKTPEEQGVLNEYIEEESVFSHWVPSWKILMPPGYHLIENMPYLIEVEDMQKVDFLANPLYKNKKDIQGWRTNPDTGGKERLSTPSYSKGGNYSDKDDDTSTVTLYHIWNRRKNKRLIISKESESPHFEGDWDGDYPYEPLMFDETLPTLTESNPYPPNLIIPILPQIIEQSLSRTQMVSWRKRASALILAQKGLASEDDMRQLENSEAVQVVYVSNIGAFQAVNTGNLPSQVFDVDALIKQDLQMGTNMGQMMFAAQPGQRTATQASISQQGLELKSSARIDMVEDMTVRVARKLCGYLWEFYNRDQIAEIIGEPVSIEMWPEKPEDKKARKKILNDLGLYIEAGSAAAPKDETVERKQLIDFISVGFNVAPEAMNKVEALKAVAKTFRSIKESGKIVIGNEEAEIAAAQQENELMAQGHPQTVSPNENHPAHIPVHNEMAGNPLADQHLADHGQYMGMMPSPNKQKAQQGGPQEGDLRPPASSTNPEIMREGNPDQGDMMSENMGAGTGREGI